MVPPGLSARWAAQPKRPAPAGASTVSDRAARSATTVAGPVTRRTAAGPSPVTAGTPARSVRAPPASCSRRPASASAAATRAAGSCTSCSTASAALPSAASSCSASNTDRSAAAVGDGTAAVASATTRCAASDIRRRTSAATGSAPAATSQRSRATSKARPSRSPSRALGHGGRAASAGDHDVHGQRAQTVLARPGRAAERIGAAGQPALPRADAQPGPHHLIGGRRDPDGADVDAAEVDHHVAAGHDPVGRPRRDRQPDAHADARRQGRHALGRPLRRPGGQARGHDGRDRGAHRRLGDHAEDRVHLQVAAIGDAGRGQAELRGRVGAGVDLGQRGDQRPPAGQVRVVGATVGDQQVLEEPPGVARGGLVEHRERHRAVRGADGDDVGHGRRRRPPPAGRPGRRRRAPPAAGPGRGRSRRRRAGPGERPGRASRRDHRWPAGTRLGSRARRTSRRCPAPAR